MQTVWRAESELSSKSNHMKWLIGLLGICNEVSPMTNKGVGAAIIGALSGVFSKYLCVKSNYEYIGNRYIAFSVAIS